MERGEVMRESLVPYGSWKTGDVIAIRLTDGDDPKLQIWLNDELKHTWENTPVQFPLFAKVLALHEAPVVEDLCWITTKNPLEARKQLEETLREEKEQLGAELGKAKEAARTAAKDKQQLEAQLQQERAAGHALADEKARLESQLQEERQASAQALADKKARLEQKKAEASQVHAENERLRAELHGAQEAAKDKQQLEAQLQQQRATGHALADGMARLESQLQEERQASAQALADEKARLEQKKAEASQAQLVKLANSRNLLASIWALISALALMALIDLVGIVRGNSD